MTRVSIVIPTLNARRYLPETLESVLTQRGDFGLEVVVVDGGSTDGTLQLVEAQRDQRIRLVAGADQGQADAINRGMQAASGDVLAWLNADDLYEPGAIAAAVQRLASPGAHWLAGSCRIVDPAGDEIRQWITRYKDQRLARLTRRVLLRENVISQPATFWRRELWERVGGVNPKLHFTMDYDLWLRFSVISMPIMVPRTLASFRLHPASKTGAVDPRQFLEQYRVACPHFGDDWMTRCVHAFNVVKIIAAYRIMRLVGW